LLFKKFHLKVLNRSNITKSKKKKIAPETFLQFLKTHKVSVADVFNFCDQRYMEKQDQKLTTYPIESSKKLFRTFESSTLKLGTKILEKIEPNLTFLTLKTFTVSH
jgi:hypothetical protein